MLKIFYRKQKLKIKKDDWWVMKAVAPVATRRCSLSWAGSRPKDYHVTIIKHGYCSEGRLFFFSFLCFTWIYFLLSLMYYLVFLNLWLTLLMSRNKMWKATKIYRIMILLQHLNKPDWHKTQDVLVYEGQKSLQSWWRAAFIHHHPSIRGRGGVTGAGL